MKQCPIGAIDKRDANTIILLQFEMLAQHLYFSIQCNSIACYVRDLLPLLGILRHDSI